jgi:hypothetical protein
MSVSLYREELKARAIGLVPGFFVKYKELMPIVFVVHVNLLFPS